MLLFYSSRENELRRIFSSGMGFPFRARKRYNWGCLWGCRCNRRLEPGMTSSPETENAQCRFHLAVRNSFIYVVKLIVSVAFLPASVHYCHLFHTVVSVTTLNSSYRWLPAGFLYKSNLSLHLHNPVEGISTLFKIINRKLRNKIRKFIDIKINVKLILYLNNFIHI